MGAACIDEAHQVVEVGEVRVQAKDRTPLGALQGLTRDRAQAMCQLDDGREWLWVVVAVTVPITDCP